LPFFAEQVEQKHGKSFPRVVVEMFLKNCFVSRKAEVNRTVVAGHKHIVTKLFMERVQMDCIDMQGFVKGLSLAYNVLPSREKEMVIFDDISTQVKSLCIDNAKYPRYLVNIADHTSKFGDSMAIESKRVHTMAWVESQGVIENQNKVALTFLTKWCLKNYTACYLLGVPAMGCAINTRINHSTKMSPYEYLYSVKPTGGLNNLPVKAISVVE
jgi:hypothetical protein